MTLCLPDWTHVLPCHVQAIRSNLQSLNKSVPSIILKRTGFSGNVDREREIRRRGKGDNVKQARLDCSVWLFVVVAMAEGKWRWESHELPSGEGLSREADRASHWPSILEGGELAGDPPFNRASGRGSAWPGSCLGHPVFGRVVQGVVIS